MSGAHHLRVLQCTAVEHRICKLSSGDVYYVRPKQHKNERHCRLCSYK